MAKAKWQRFASQGRLLSVYGYRHVRQLPPVDFVAPFPPKAQCTVSRGGLGVLSMKASPPHSNGAAPLHWQQNGGKALLSITISDPEKHGSSSSLTNAFVDFKIETRTELPQFCAKEFFVRRRYRDFVWLRQRLCTAFPGAIVPPLPEPDSLLKDDRFSSAFIQRRQAGLQLFLRRVASHSALARGADLQTFLEAKVWELQTAKNANSSSWLTSVLSGTEASLSYATTTITETFRPKEPEAPAVASLRAFSAEYSADVAKVAASHQPGPNLTLPNPNPNLHPSPNLDPSP